MPEELCEQYGLVFENLWESRRRALREVLDLTQQMRRCADAEDWEGVRGIQRHRDDHLKHVFQEPVAAAEREPLVAAIRAIQAADRQLQERAAAAREAVLEELAGFEQRREAAVAYRRHER